MYNFPCGSPLPSRDFLIWQNFHGFLRNLMVIYTGVAIFACYILLLHKICWHFDFLLVWFLSISMYRIISYSLYASSFFLTFVSWQIALTKTSSILLFKSHESGCPLICSWCHRKGFSPVTPHLVHVGCSLSYAALRFWSVIFWT